MIRPLTLAELLALPAAFDLETAGRAWGFGRTKSHQLARQERFPCPVLRLGRTYRVTRTDLLRSLGFNPDANVACPAPPGPATSAMHHSRQPSHRETTTSDDIHPERR